MMTMLMGVLLCFLGAFHASAAVVSQCEAVADRGPQEYYPRGLPLAAVIKRCLMFGYTSGGHDLPMGSVKGYDRDGIFGFVQVGTYWMDRRPAHSE